MQQNNKKAPSNLRGKINRPARPNDNEAGNPPPAIAGPATDPTPQQLQNTLVLWLLMSANFDTQAQLDVIANWDTMIAPYLQAQGIPLTKQAFQHFQYINAADLQDSARLLRDFSGQAGGWNGTGACPYKPPVITGLFK